MTRHMPTDFNAKSVTVVRRQPAQLPSVRGHALRALAILILLTGLIGLIIYALSDPRDAIAEGEVNLGPRPLPEASDSLNGTTNALPDLLNGVVPEGQNPTETIDALGNPIVPGRDNGLAGGTQPVVIPAAPPSQPARSSGPRTIMIDGQPLDGSLPVRAQSPLMRAPLEGLTRASPFGLIPRPSPDGRKAVTSYARPFSPVSGKSPVSVIIGGLGIDRNLTRRAINELPPEITLSFAAHANGLQNWIHQARSQGHEVLIELPMESASSDPADAGAEHMLSAQPSPARNIRNLDWLMSRAQGYFAVTNYNGDVLVRRADALAPIFAHLSDAGLGFIYDGSAAAPTLAALASSTNLPFKQAYTLIDADTSDAAIQTELLRLEAQASGGTAPIGVGFTYPGTLTRVKAWTQTLDAKNLVLAPASHALSRR